MRIDMEKFDLEDLSYLTPAELHKIKNEAERLIKTKECPIYTAGDVLMFEDGWSIKLYKMIGYDIQFDETMCKFEYIKLGKNSSSTIYKGFDRFFPYEIVDLGFELVDSKLWDKAEELYSIYCTKFDEVDLKWKTEIASITNEMITKFKESMI